MGTYYHNAIYISNHTMNYVQRYLNSHVLLEILQNEMLHQFDTLLAYIANCNSIDWIFYSVDAGILGSFLTVGGMLFGHAYAVHLFALYCVTPWHAVSRINHLRLISTLLFGCYSFCFRFLVCACVCVRHSKEKFVSMQEYHNEC